MTRTPDAPALTRAEAEDFLIHEAALLDAGRFADWLDLFIADATYWVPLVEGQRDPDETSSIIHDDLALLKIRVAQYGHARAHARRPLPRTVHQVGNVRVTGDWEGDVEVASNLIVLEYRLERQRIWGAQVTHRLVREGERLRIARKRVDLINSEAELDGITILF